MTLTVSSFWHDPVSGKSQTFTDWEHGHYMAGVERARQELWGSDAVKRRGATFLPQLALGDLWIAPENVEAFASEVRHLLTHVDDLRSELGRGADCTLPHYLHNFLRAAKYAAERGGGVSIT
jgi:hypothetical protein